MRARDLFSDEPDEKRVLSVWELTAQIKDLLESSFPTVWVTGEISNLARPSSGHCYLTLKDDRSQLRAAIWRNTAARLRFDLHDGLEVICRGHVDVYAPRGSYQLIVEHVEPRGIGALELALRQLREKLQREGLFDQSRKQPLPAFVRRIAVVTSPTGAAIHDFLQVLGRRWRGADVLIVPTRVQGQGAAEEIAAAVRGASRLNPPPDCLVVTRGGGSLEDLWAFNDERVARAIAGSRLPVICGVGHETDFSLADFAADVRAPTPSAAAELVAPDRAELRAYVRGLTAVLTAALQAAVDDRRWRLSEQTRALAHLSPAVKLAQSRQRLDDLLGRAEAELRHGLILRRERLDGLVGRLAGVSPLGTLERGYAIVRHQESKDVICSVEQATSGDTLSIRVADGEFEAKVT